MVRYHAIGGPEVLQVDEVELGALAPGDVRIAVHAIGLNRIEAMERRGAFGPPPFPATLGYEAAGVVEDVGAAVRGFRAGDRVAIVPGVAPAGYGTYGDVLDYPASMLTVIPEGLPYEVAAASWMQYLTAYGLIEAAGVRADDVVVITAASSSVGLAAIELANDVGATCIAVTRGGAKAEALRQHGARHVVVSGEQDVAAQVLALTGGLGARIVFDAVAGADLGAMVEATAPRGAVIVYGMLGGLPETFPLTALMLNNIVLRGWSMGMLTADPAARDRCCAYIGERLGDGRFAPVIDSRFPLDRIIEAHRRLESNCQFGKIVVTTAAKP